MSEGAERSQDGYGGERLKFCGAEKLAEVSAGVKIHGSMSLIPRIAKTFEGVSLNHEEIRRYGRHLIMPEVTLDGQK